jgi:hypothetical protein
MTETPQEDTQGDPGLAEGYPTLSQVLRGLLQGEDVPDVGIRRLEINCFASGDATYNYTQVGQEEALGGYLDELA